LPLPVFKKENLQDRPHVSFSEGYSFFHCPWNHWITYRLKGPREETIYTVYGKEMGLALERYKKNGVKLAWISLGKAIFKHILENGFGEMVNEKDQDWRFWVRAAIRNFNDTLVFLDETYPEWELIDFEYPLYEDIPGSNKKFKGFIDLIFKYKNRIKILDFKSTTLSWDKKKRSDTHKLYQVVLYKNLYCQKHNIDPNTVDVGYLLLLRKPAKKAKTSVELFEQTSGPVKLQNSIDWLSQQARGIEKGVNIKNKTTCSFCQCGESDDEKKWAAYRANKKALTNKLPVLKT
jgi:hypothetical protein